MLSQHEVTLRVRYNECDPMGYLHHANYLVYFEIARTELLRAAGGNYRDMEAQGQFVVVVRADCHYRRPARYDDLLRVHVRIAGVSAAKIEHEYRVLRGEDTAGHRPRGPRRAGSRRQSATRAGVDDGGGMKR